MQPGLSSPHLRERRLSSQLQVHFNMPCRIPAKVKAANKIKALDSRLRGNDEIWDIFRKKQATVQILYPPCYRADGAKVATKERALGGHAINWYSARFMGDFGNRLFEPKDFIGRVSDCHP